MTQLHICARSFWRAWASPTSCITLYIHPGLSPYTFTLGYHPRLLYHPINRFIDKSTISLIFKGLVRPHLEYAAPIWNPHLEKQKEAIENVQRRATKLIPGLFHMSYPDRLKELIMLLNISSVFYRIPIWLFIYDYFNDSLINFIRDFVSTRKHRRNGLIFFKFGMQM